MALAASRVVAATGSDDLLVQPIVPPVRKLLLRLFLPVGGIPMVMVTAEGILSGRSAADRAPNDSAVMARASADPENRLDRGA